jgi:hydrogenase maturation protein HypF
VAQEAIKILMMSTFHIHLEGLVQGIGFRPFIYQLATSRGLKGVVSNEADGVHILLDCNASTADSFLKEILHQPPPLSVVESWSLEEVQNHFFKDFSIIKEDTTATPHLQITPDLGICPACKNEIRDQKDRRFAYAFNTCIHCGPRYSIINALPYDRENTVMDAFTMCPECHKEYIDPNTRRHYSQTNSCPDCGIHMEFISKSDAGWISYSAPSNELIQKTVKALKSGAILAVKGIGGFLLVCDATNSDAIQTLRKRKNRPGKPFALMFPNEATLQNYTSPLSFELSAYTSIESPIVLIKKNESVPFPWEDIAPGLDSIGAMQAYTPLFQIILDAFQKPIVATSGNTSGAPICFEDEKVQEDLGNLVDGILIHNRPILIPQDDSLVRFSKKHQSRIVLRRSRGLAPTFIQSIFKNWDTNGLLAMGADLKAAFGIFQKNNTYISQYLGNLESYDSQQSFELSLKHLLSLLSAKPTRILLDKHPGYYSNLLGKKLASSYGVQVYPIQHHKAHFAAVLGENNLLDRKKQILGVIWDGTGWGENNKHILGGEFFLFKNKTITAYQSMESFPVLLGDKMAKEPRLSALSLFGTKNPARVLLKQQFSDKEWYFYNKILTQKNEVKTSSMGRLFDGIASILGICSINTYEGEAAMKLEKHAANAHQKGTRIELPEGEINLDFVLQNILDLVEKGVAIDNIALQFHRLLVEWIFQIAKSAGSNCLAFSGGVFQNALLIDLLQDRFSSEYELYFHRQLSPNDECIAFGQLCCAYLEDKKQGEKNNELSMSLKNEVCV